MMTRAAMAALLSALVIGLVSDLAAQELVVSPVAIDKSTEVEKEATFHNRKWVLRTGQVSGFFICQGDNKDIYYRHDRVGAHCQKTSTGWRNVLGLRDDVPEVELSVYLGTVEGVPVKVLHQEVDGYDLKVQYRLHVKGQQMSESVRRSTPMVKIKVLPSFVGVPFPSVLLIVAGLLNGPLWGFAAFVFHIVIKRYIYREYRRLPYPMPTGSRPMDELSDLLVKGDTGGIFPAA